MAKKFNAEKALAGIENGGVEATTEVQNAPTKVGAKRFNAEKALAGIELETPEDKERAETMMSIGKLNRDLMGGQLQQIGADIPDFTNKWTYDYLMSDEKPSTEVDTEAQMYRNPLATEEALTPDSVVVGVDVQKPLRGVNLQDSIKSLYDTENEDFLSSKRAVSSHIVDKYEVDKDGFVTIGEQRMPRAQAEMIMQDIVEQTMHPTMMQKNKAYRDNWFIGNTGMNAEDYLRNLDANLASLQQELNTEVGKDIDAIRSTTTALQMAENAGIDPAVAQAIVTNERYGGKAIRDMRDQIQSILNNDFGSGLKEGFDALSMISAGLNDLVANVELGNVLNKVYNDKPLTEREKIAYEAYMIGDQINELEDLFGGRSWWNEVGQGVGASGEMAVGFAAGMGAVGKLGKFANLPVRAAIKSVRRAAKSGAWDAIKMAGIRGAQLAGRSLKNVVIAEGAGLIAAPMLPSTYASLAEKRNGQYAVENGKLIFKPTKAWKDVIDTWIESGTEIGSELIGARIGEVVGGSARAFGRMLSLDKIAAKAGIGKHSKILFGWEKPATFKAFERSVGFQGAVAEPLSEIWGDAAANMLKGIITGNGEFAQFRDVDYWTKTLATCAIYGGSLQVASAPHAVARYANIASYGRERKRALSRIKIAKLHNDVSAALAIDNIDDAAKAFAQIDWSSYSLDQRAYAMDAIRADYAQRVAIANQVEDGRMTQFLHVADRIEDMEYRGMDGLTPKGFIKTIVDKDGVTYTAIQGDKDKPFYICLDANGNKVSIPTANIEGERNIALGDVISQQYDSMYSVESEQERQRNIVDRYNDMRKGESSAESIKRIMSLFGVKQYRSGDDVTLVNGETATVEEFIPETGEFIVSLHNGGMETLPFYNVLSESMLTADAQKLNNASTVNANVEQQIDAEERSAEAANEPRTTRFVEGDIVVTPTGAQARVREVNEDGTYEVDYNTEEEANPSNMILENYAEADLRFENEGIEVAPTEVVPQEIEVAEIEQTAPESNADATMPEAKPIPQNEDGTINYDAIDDAEQFATLYEREVGGRENAIQDVADMRDSAQEDLLKSIEKGKKMRNANEKVANRREQQALAERVAFYNNVLDILAPAEQTTNAEETAPVEQTTNEVQAVPSQSAEAEVKQSGLIANEYSEQLTADFAESLDAVAKAFGLRVMFVPLAGGGKANAEIDGNEVRIAWKARGKAIHFLIGHEFTHRMQDLSPEEYSAFKAAVIKYLGEEVWNARIAEIKETYDKQAVAYTDTLIEDEAVADFVGELIEDADSFDLFIAQNAKEGWFKRFIEALKALFSKLSKTDVKAELYKDVLDKLGAMASKATEVAMKDAEVSESTERLREQGAIVDAERGDVRLSVADVLTGDQREQAIADLMRVTGRSRRTVLSYLKAEESLANIILSGDNKAFLDIQVDESVPSIWSNSDYPQGTVEFSNICRKRLPFTMIYQRLQKDFPNTVFDASSLESIRQTLIANGEEVACGLCFVEDRRQLLGEIGQGFIKALKGEMIELNDKQQEAIARMRESGDTYIPNLYELITLDGMKILRKEHPEIANAFVAYNNARGMQAGRLFQAYSAYHRDILNYDAKKVAKINNAGGLRIFSFSDFEAHHLIDLVQVLTDCAAKGIKVQGYTKVPQFAKAVKDTKMKVNRSLIAKAKGVVDADYIPQEGEAVSPNVVNGKRLLFDTVEGIDVNNPNFFDSTDSKNVGNILVGISDEHIRIAMLDPFVDYIIGFHTGLSEAIREQKGIADWTNYKYTQLEKILKDGKLVNADKHGINIYTEVLTPEIKTERQFVRRYLKVCEEKGWIPKYHRFLNKSKSGKFIYTKGYYKLLLDFKMFDANGRIFPQEVVVPVFDNEVNAYILEEYVEGEKAKAPNDELYGKVVDAMVERGVLTEAQVSEAMQKASAMEGVRFSLAVMRGLSDALNEYKVNDDIATFVENVREVNDKVALGHPKIEIILALYEEDGDAEWFAEKIAEIVGDYDGEYAPYTAGGVKFSLSEETTKIFDAAKAKFGTTVDMREAGYILPDGSMLDFSGRHQVEGDASFLNGDRTVDHREISDIAYDNDNNETGIKTDLGDFLDRGAIRIDSNAGAINLNVAPTKAQKDRLKRLIERNDGYVYIDFGKGWDTEHYAEYEAARASRVLGDIDRYFDEGIKPTGNVRFSLQETNDRFNAELATLTEENAREKILNVGTPSSILLACGIENKPIRLYGAKLLSKVRKHGYDLDDLKNLPLAMSKPIAVFNGSKPNSFAILTELRVGDNNILVALSVGKGGHDVDFNIISSVYDKRGNSVARWVNDGKMLWVDKKKALDYFSVSAPLAEAQNNQELISTANIIQNFQNPKIEPRNSLITPEMDASYLDAVERGDMATAQKMVMEAAKLAMPNTKVVDEDGNPKVVYHQTNNSVYINRETGQNWDELDWRERMEWDERDDWDDYWEEREFNTFSRVNARTTQELDGFFFAPEYDEYHEYGNRTISAFLNITNPASFGDYNIDSSKTNAGRDERIRLQNEGYDGVINEEDGAIWEYIAFIPNQIKSADAVTYDDNGNVIPLSERFNPKKEDIRYSISDAPTFYSNAEYAVRNIKQEKAAPEQWLKMIEKAGGLKAGEDKWLGLSDWLKASDKKTLTKDEVLQYIAENDIQIEEVSYGDVADISREEIYESAEFAELREGLTEYDEDDNPYINRERYEELRSESYDFVDGFTLDYWGEELEVDSPAAAATYLGLTKADKEINETRLNYTTQGLSNKREIALTVPTIEPWNTNDNIHFGDAGEGRAVAWIRFGEATDADGKRVLVIDEIQSKRHQEGREKGYRDVEAEKREKAERERELTEVVLPRLAELNQLYNEKYGVGKWIDTEYDRQWRPRRVYRLLTPEEQAEHEAIAQRATELQMPMPRRSGIPSAPFEKNWAELAFKRMLRYAAENGYDYVAWTTGDQQADRYDIGSVVKDIVAYDTKDADGNPIKKMKFRMNNMGTYNIATNMEGVIVKGDGEMKEGMRLSDITGKALAEKIMNGEGEDAMVFENGKDIEAKSLEGEELHIGNEGMKAFYDQMLPSFVKKYTKKWGAEVGEVTMPDLEENNTMHAVNVTDSMREGVMQGQPKFSLKDELFNEYAAEVDSLENEFSKIDPAIIDSKRLYRAHKREVIQRYADHIADVLNLPCESFAVDIDDDSQIKDAYYKYMRSHEEWTTQHSVSPNYIPMREFVAMVKKRVAVASYIPESTLTLLFISETDGYDTSAQWLETLFHENTHKIIETLGISDFEKEIVYNEAKRINPKAAAKIDNGYPNATIAERGEEVIAFAIEGRLRAGEVLLDYLEGRKDVKDVLDTYKYNVPLRNQVIRKVIKTLKYGYERSQNESRGVSGIENNPSNVRFRGKLADQRGDFASLRGRYDRNGREVAPRFSVRDADMADAKATEEMVRVYMKRQHQINKANIRKRYNALRAVGRRDYAEKRTKRLDKIKSMLSNAGKVVYILGDIAEQTIPYVHQALAKIARGEVRIMWDDSPDGKKRGIASELGAKKGEKRLYASVTKGATLYFDGYVHQWWEELGGYENDIDTQDLRNALIEALGEASNSNYAIAKLREIYDNDAQQRDEILESYDFEEERELAEESARYEKEVAEFDNNKEARITEFKASASFFDELAAVDGTLSEIRTRLAKIEERTKQRIEGAKGKLREMREAIAEVKKLIKETITSKTLASMQRNELRGMLDKLDKARSLADVQAIAVEVENTLLDVQIREKRKDLDKMLQLRLPNGESVSAWVDALVAEGKMSASDARKVLDDMWRGKNASGVRVAKWIDEGTAKVMNKLRELIQPTLKSKLVEDVDAEIRGQYTRKDEELTLSVDGAIVQNEERLAELNAKLAHQEREGADNVEHDERFSDEDMAEYLARGIYDSYLRSVAYKQDVQLILEGIDEVLMKYYGMADKKATCDYQIEKLREELADAKRKYAEALDALNNDVLQIIREGKDALSAFRIQQDAHKRMIINLGLNAIRIDPRLIANPQKVGVMHRVKAAVRGILNVPYWTFQTTLKEIDRLAPNGEGAFYKYFMGAWSESTNQMIRQHSDHCTTVAEAITSMLGIKGNIAADVIGDAIEQSDAKILGYISYGKGVGADGSIIKEERLPLTISNIMYVIAMWRQPMYRNSLIKHGIDEKTIDSLYDMLNRENPAYITFMNWVNETLLPETRLLYDKVHKEMFGASMAKERNYFPARVVSYQENVDVGNENSGVLPSTITGAIISRKKNALMPDISQNYFKVLMGHLQDMDRWSAYAPLIRDLNTLLSNTEFKNACRQYKPGVKADGTGWGDLYDIFRNVSAIALECYKPKSNPIDDALMKGLKGWATSNISWRALTAIKQLASMPIFAVYALDAKMPLQFVKTATYAFAHPIEAIKWARNMSPSFKKRWDSGFAGMDILNTKIGSENGKADLAEHTKSKWHKKAKAFDEAIKTFAVDWGMAPNKAVDAFAVAVGLKAVYEYELQRIMKADGNSTPTEAQKNEAMKKAEVAFNATQQSSEGAFLSTVQANRSILLRGLTVYQNSPFAFHRLLLTSANEFYKQMFNEEYKSENDKESLRAARRKAFAQLAQSAAGTYLFALMGEGLKELFLLCAGGEDDGEEYNTILETLGWATATMLGGGFVGGSAAISALQGYNTSLTAAWDDITNTVKRLWKMDRFSLESVYTTLNLITTYRYGVDLDTFMNIAKGVDGIFERTGDTEAIMQILNAPQSQVNLIAGMRREGESAMDYVVRRMRIQSLVYDPEYKDIFNEKGTFIGSRDIDDDPHKIREYQARKLLSEYDDAYTRNVVTHFGGKGKLSEMAEHDADYKAAVESLNWKPEASPSHTQNIAWGEYRAPIENLAIEAYAELAEAQERIAYLSKNIERFGGSEEQYYELVELLDSLKVNFKIKYDELIK